MNTEEEKLPVTDPRHPDFNYDAYAVYKKDEVSLEDECIGDLKGKFLRSTINEQRKVSISVSEVQGSISLAFHRGLSAGTQKRSQEREMAKGDPQHAVDFAEFIARGNYEHDAGKLVYWNEVEDPQFHGEDGPESLTTQELYDKFQAQSVEGTNDKNEKS
ncbi:MAG: hypothetical protein H7Y42_04890 [Chitinophagaceae bacterium]|nr:hypothetical protein [Chitinophagaceae bacterium]